MSGTIRTYHPSFSEEDATIVLTSSDATSYRMHPFTLRTTSGFFRDMISLPQNGVADVKAVQDEQIALDEGSKVLTPLLKMISGLATEKWKSLEEMEGVLNAAQKYDMAGPISTIRSTVTSKSPSKITLENPLRMYIIAARNDWDEEAQDVSAHTLNVCLHDETLAPMIQQVPSPYLLKLFHLHRSRREKFREYIERDNRRFGIDVCNSCRSGRQQTPLEQLAQMFVWEMDRQPEGKLLEEGAWKEWPLYKGNMCPHDSATMASKCGEKIAEDIRVGLKSLPMKTW